MARQDLIISPDVAMGLWEAKQWVRWSRANAEQIQQWPGGGTAEAFVLLLLLGSVDHGSHPLFPGCPDPVLTRAGRALDAVMQLQYVLFNRVVSATVRQCAAKYWIDQRRSWLPYRTGPQAIDDQHLLYLALCGFSAWQTLIEPPTAGFMQALRQGIGFTAAAAVSPVAAAFVPQLRRRLY